MMDIDKAKTKLKNGENMTIGYGLIDKNNYDLNPPFNIVCMLASCLVSIYATHNHINSNLKMRVKCRECSIEIDTRYPEHELLDHYNISHKN